MTSSYLLLPKYVKELQKLRPGIPLYSIEFDQTVADSSGPSIERLIFIAPAQPRSDFVEKFKFRWQANPDIAAAQSYDAANLLI